MTKSVVFENAAGPEYATSILIFITEMSLAIESSLDYEQVLSQVVSLAVPRFADYCLLDIVREDGTLYRSRAAHRDPKKEWLLQRSQSDSAQQSESNSDAQLLWSRATDQSDGVSPGTDFTGVLNPASCISVPLVARKRKLGAITFVTAESGRYYAQEDQTLAKLISRHFALAIDSAQQFEAERRLRIAAEQALAAGTHP